MKRYRAVAHSDLRILQFDDEAVVFNPFLWQTHLLNPAAALILDLLDEVPATASELAAALGDDSGRPVVALADVRTVLEDLVALRLVEGTGAAEREP